MKNICIVTGTRAEYGLLRPVITGINGSKYLSLSLVVTGSHLSPEFGETVQEIEDDGFPIDRQVEILLSSNSSVGVSKSIGLGVIGFADVFDHLKPDAVVFLGDRFEMLSAATAAMVALIPIAHIHGGEVTTGALDDNIRHAITKMSHLHFVAAEDYRRRVVQLGECPDRVFVVGGLGVDSIKERQLYNRAELEEVLSMKILTKTLLVTFHPLTVEENNGLSDLDQLLQTLKIWDEVQLVFTMPNADAGSREFIQRIEEFVGGCPNARVYNSLGQKTYLSCLEHFDGVIGNSSSGLLEVPSFEKGSINIGGRQQGRLRSSSVIDCAANKADINKALEKLFSLEFQSSLKNAINPYGSGGASKEIVKILENQNLSALLQKKFFDLTQF
jgi:GDP/UDP-N,N'-diacetylbacillosamine 2-epimerase (hydrolysing)